MATIESYTDLEQSKKLEEILPLESADMCYLQENGQAKTISPSKLSEILNISKPQVIPCWSLEMLLRILSDAAANIDEDGYVDAVVCRDICSITLVNCNDKFEKADNLVDACVAMIERLHELNLL